MAKFVTLDDRQLRRYEKDLRTFSDRALLFATRATVNKGAKSAQTEWRKTIDQRMTTRNVWTRNSIKVQTANQRRISKQVAVVGSLQPYLEHQEFGHTKTSKGKKGVILPTRFASGEGRGSSPRKRLPRKAQKVTRGGGVKLQRRKGGTKGRAQANMLAVKEAAKAGGARHIYMHTRRGPGIFRVKGNKKSIKVDMVADLSRKAVRIPPNPTLIVAVKRVAPRMPGIYRKELKRQMVRHRIFRPGL